MNTGLLPGKPKPHTDDLVIETSSVFVLVAFVENRVFIYLVIEVFLSVAHFSYTGGKTILKFVCVLKM